MIRPPYTDIAFLPTVTFNPGTIILIDTATLFLYHILRGAFNNLDIIPIICLVPGRQTLLSGGENGMGARGVATCPTGVLRQLNFPLVISVVTLAVTSYSGPVLLTITSSPAPLIDERTVLLLNGERSCGLIILTLTFPRESRLVVLNVARIRPFTVIIAMLEFLSPTLVPLTGTAQQFLGILFATPQRAPLLKKTIGLPLLTVVSNKFPVLHGADGMIIPILGTVANSVHKSRERRVVVSNFVLRTASTAIGIRVPLLNTQWNPVFRPKILLK